jgi:hypothetical protein
MEESQHASPSACTPHSSDDSPPPNVNDTPRSFSDHPVMSLSGSDHNRSQRRPMSGATKKDVNSSSMRGVNLLEEAYQYQEHRWVA